MYTRETIEEANCIQIRLRFRKPHRELILLNKDTFKFEKWSEAPHYAGYAIKYNGGEFEFISEVEIIGVETNCD